MPNVLFAPRVMEALEGESTISRLDLHFKATRPERRVDTHRGANIQPICPRVLRPCSSRQAALASSLMTADKESSRFTSTRPTFAGGAGVSGRPPALHELSATPTSVPRPEGIGQTVIKLTSILSSKIDPGQVIELSLDCVCNSQK